MGVSALALTATSRASADEAEAATAAKHDKTYTGVVVSVDPQEHVLKMKHWLSSKSFNLGNTCDYRLLDNRTGTISDLHPGQKARVEYQNVEGVPVADHFEQFPMRYEGKVEAIDPEKHTLTLHHNALTKTFQIGDGCRVTLRHDKSGTLDNVKPGSLVTVTYEIPNDTPTAQQIAQTSAEFTGSLTAIDLSERTLKAKGMFGSKRFIVVNDCAIVLNGRTDAQLSDLKPGEQLVFSYDDVNGINILNRIAPAGADSSTMAQSK